MAEVVTVAPKAELQEAMIKGEQSARQAIALDDSNAKAHPSMAAFHLSLNGISRRPTASPKG